MTEATVENKEEKKEEKVEELKKEEQKVEQPKEEKPKEKTGLKLFKGSNKKEKAENISFLIIVASAIMLVVGIALGSFIQDTVYIAIAGAFFVMFGIVVYIISQIIGE